MSPPRRAAPSQAATRGTVVHAVLEDLFDLPRGERSLEAATALVPAVWARVLGQDEQLAALFADDDGSLNRRDPRQPELPLREVPAAGDVREVAS